MHAALKDATYITPSISRHMVTPWVLRIIKEAIREKRINLLMLLCVSGKGSHLVSVMHNSHTEHIHIHIFQYFLSFP